MSIDDIEDIGEQIDPSIRRYERSAVVFPRTKKHERIETNAKSLPEGKLVYVKTFGCAHNMSDSEYMCGILASEGYAVTSERAKDADAWVINSCTVKDPSEIAFRRVVKEGLDSGKAVVVAGCVPQAQRDLLEALRPASAIGVKALGRVGEAVDAALRGETFWALSARGPLPELSMPKIRKHALVEIIPLSTGCLGSCTYCKTRYARGKLGSYQLEAIIQRFETALYDGVAEIWLSSEDTGAYGRDIGTSLSHLLEALIVCIDSFSSSKKKPCPTMLRVGMTNPPFVLDQLDALAKCLKHPNVFAFLHVPVQAGSDTVLKRMNREYTISDFEQVVFGLKQRLGSDFPLTISTDIICGFPGENETDFDQTFNLVQRHTFSICHISQFYARQGTPAAKMRPRVPTSIVKARSRKLSILINSFNPYASLQDTILRCYARDELENEYSATSRLVAHTKSYVKILIPFRTEYVGAHLHVRVTATHRWHVDAQVIDIILTADRDDRPALADALSRMQPHVHLDDQQQPISNSLPYVSSFLNLKKNFALMNLDLLGNGPFFFLIALLSAAAALVYYSFSSPPLL